MINRVCSVRYTGTRFFCGRTEITEVSGTGIKFVPNHTGVFGRVLRPYRTLPKTSVGYLPRKYPRYTYFGTYPTEYEQNDLAGPMCEVIATAVPTLQPYTITRSHAPEPVSNIDRQIESLGFVTSLFLGRFAKLATCRRNV